MKKIIKALKELETIEIALYDKNKREGYLNYNRIVIKDILNFFYIAIKRIREVKQSTLIIRDEITLINKEKIVFNQCLNNITKPVELSYYQIFVNGVPKGITKFASHSLKSPILQKKDKHINKDELKDIGIKIPGNKGLIIPGIPADKEYLFVTPEFNVKNLVIHIDIK